MISSFYCSNLKGTGPIKIDNIKNCHFITGKNGVGKTALLMLMMSAVRRNRVQPDLQINYTEIGNPRSSDVALSTLNNPPYLLSLLNFFVRIKADHSSKKQYEKLISSLKILIKNFNEEDISSSFSSASNSISIACQILIAAFHIPYRVLFLDCPEAGLHEDSITALVKGMNDSIILNDTQFIIISQSNDFIETCKDIIGLDKISYTRL